MKVSLEIKQKCSFFWLRGIKTVHIDQCCAECFDGDVYNEIYKGTRFKDKAFVELELTPDERIKAYYLCGLSKGFEYENNTHVAFVPCEGQNIEIDNERIRLVITNARQIDFQSYKPNPKGEFTEKQRKCRNWIFANYLQDGMPL